MSQDAMLPAAGVVLCGVLLVLGTLVRSTLFAVYRRTRERAPEAPHDLDAGLSAGSDSLDDPQRLLNVAAIASQLLYLWFVYFMVEVVRTHEDGSAALIAVAVLAAAVYVVAGEVVPRCVAMRTQAALERRLLPPASAVLRLFAIPLYALVDLAERRLNHSSSAAESFTNEELRQLVDRVTEEGAIEEDAGRMLEDAMELRHTLVREIMVPRTDMVVLPVTSTVDQILATIESTGHSRIPLYHNRVDNIEGVVYIIDLLAAIRAHGLNHPDLRSLWREPLFVPETKPIDDLLHELRQKQVHIALVVDEYGGIAGLVTIEDILEEIFGEIQDEYDREERLIEWLDEEIAVVDARISIADLEDAFAVDIPDGAYDTLAGYLFARTGRVPDAGETVELPGVTFVVVDASDRRIHRVRIERRPASDGL